MRRQIKHKRLNRASFWQLLAEIDEVFIYVSDPLAHGMFVVSTNSEISACLAAWLPGCRYIGRRLYLSSDLAGV